MRDIAREMNLSVVSVSKALSGKEGVSDAVRSKIRKKADEMGYTYNSGANSPAVGHNVGVVVSQNYISDSAFYYKLYQTLVLEFGALNYSCMMEIISEEDEKAGVLPNLLSARKVDGVIIMGPLAQACTNAIMCSGVPCVFLDNYDADMNVDAVVSDNVYGSAMLTNYLIAKGHKKIAFVGSIDATYSIMDRYLGYYKSLIQNGMQLQSEYVINDRVNNGTIFTSYPIPKEMPDAYVCNCDETAYRLTEYLKHEGIRVPEDVSVVGFDDFIWATVCDPKLTTFRVNMEQMGKSVVEMMAGKLEEKDYIGGRKVICGEIVIRDSVRERNVK